MKRTILMALAVTAVYPLSAQTVLPQFQLDKSSGALQVRNPSTNSNVTIGTINSNGDLDLTTGGVQIKNTLQTPKVNLIPGTGVTAPANGDMWSTDTGVFANVNGMNVSLTRPQYVNSATVYGMDPKQPATTNTAGLTAAFASPNPQVLQFGPGTYNLSCAQLTASSSISLVGAGMGTTVLRYPAGCTFTAPALLWDAKSNVKVADLTIDLNTPTYPSLTGGLMFRAYAGDASNLTVDHVGIINGATQSLQILVAAAGGHIYSGALISNNYLQMTPDVTTNNCIALTTVNGVGYIPSAKIVNNTCIGSGIQSDGLNTLVSGNDISGFKFGNAIYAQQNTPISLTNVTWSGGTATVSYANAPNFFVTGQNVGIQNVLPAGYNGLLKVTAVTPTSISYALAANPGAYTSGGLAVTVPSHFGCMFSNNIMHDTTNGVDINNSVHNGIENSCVNSTVVGNRAYNLGGSGYINFASGAKYIGNTATDTGYVGNLNTAGTEGDKSAFYVTTSGNGISWYTSKQVSLQGNSVLDDGIGNVKYGYFEVPNTGFDAKLRGNDFRGATQDLVVNSNLGSTTSDIGYTKTFSQMVSAGAAMRWTNLDTNSYHRWKLSCRDLTPTTSDKMSLQYGEGSPVSWLSSSNYKVVQSENANGTVNSSAVTGTGILMGLGNYDNNQASPGGFTAEWNDIGRSIGNKITSFRGSYNQNGSLNAYSGTGMWVNDTNPITALQLSPASGGTFYGVCTLEGFIN
jgi:hypothetical protein